MTDGTMIMTNADDWLHLTGTADLQCAAFHQSAPCHDEWITQTGALSCNRYKALLVTASPEMLGIYNETANSFH